jgi:hypothetical protein
VRRWSRQEIEELTVPQLCRWLEALGTDVAPAVLKEPAVARLWEEIESNRPPALGDVQKDQLQLWPPQEALRWLEYFGKADEDVADKAALVRMLLEHGDGRDLPPPPFLATPEEAFLMSVMRHVALVKEGSATMLTQLRQQIADIEAATLAVHGKAGLQFEWYPNGRVRTAFDGTAFAEAKTQNAGTGDDAGNAGNSTSKQHQFMDAAVGEQVDFVVYGTSGWA